jgi:hypothetical protein
MRKIPDITALRRGRSRGFSLVELLVAAAIGIIASLAIFQVFAVFEGQKRTTTSGGEAQTSGTLACCGGRELRQGMAASTPPTSRLHLRVDQQTVALTPSRWRRPDHRANAGRRWRPRHGVVAWKRRCAARPVTC